MTKRLKSINKEYYLIFSVIIPTRQMNCDVCEWLHRHSKVESVIILSGEEGQASSRPSVTSVGWWPNSEITHWAGFMWRFRGSEQIAAPPELIRMPPGLVPAPPCGGFSGRVRLGCDPEHTGVYKSNLARERPGTPGGAEGRGWREGRLGLLLPKPPPKGAAENRWMKNSLDSESDSGSDELRFVSSSSLTTTSQS